MHVHLGGELDTRVAAVPPTVIAAQDVKSVEGEDRRHFIGVVGGRHEAEVNGELGRRILTVIPAESVRVVPRVLDPYVGRVVGEDPTAIYGATGEIKSANVLEAGDVSGKDRRGKHRQHYVARVSENLAAAGGVLGVVGAQRASGDNF
jgi:hypothetical protein